jgi:hypothetical protein
MVDWFAYNNSLLKRRNMPFRSNILNMWNTKMKNINKNNLDRHSLCTNHSITITTPIVSTRGHFSLHTGKLNLVHNLGDYNYSYVPGLGGYPSPDNKELAIYIHGVWTGQASAKEQIDRTKLSLNANGYNIPVVGFSWDSNTATNPSGWNIAKIIANQNGPKLANFISDFKANSPNCNIRIIAHSLGAKIVESTLISLYNNNQKWKKSLVYNITSIHLIGAAISDKAPSKNQPFGIAIENIVNHFYNLYNPEDNALKRAYVKTEDQNPLGLFGLKKGEASPANYSERNVMFEIPPFTKASGIYQTFCDKAVYGWGDYHCGYIGFRESYPFNKVLKDDGAINVIVEDWSTNNR